MLGIRRRDESELEKKEIFIILLVVSRVLIVHKQRQIHDIANHSGKNAVETYIFAT